MFTEFVHPSKNTLYRIGCYAYVAIGSIHLSFSLLDRLLGNGPAPEALTDALPVIDLLGSSRNFYDLGTGFSFAMGLLLISLGLLLLQQRNEPQNAARIATVTSLGILIISAQYFFVVPVVTMGLAAIAFGVTALGGREAGKIA